MKKRITRRFPASLRKDGKKLYGELLRQHPDLNEDAHHFLLVKTCEAADLAALAHAEVARLGPNVVDPKGRVVKNPACSAWKDAMNVINANYRLLGLEWQAPAAQKQPRKQLSPYNIGAK